jgi:hypothetical protein
MRDFISFGEETHTVQYQDRWQPHWTLARAYHRDPSSRYGSTCCSLGALFRNHRCAWIYQQ